MKSLQVGDIVYAHDHQYSYTTPYNAFFGCITSLSRSDYGSDCIDVITLCSFDNIETDVTPEDVARIRQGRTYSPYNIEQLTNFVYGKYFRKVAYQEDLATIFSYLKQQLDLHGYHEGFLMHKHTFDVKAPLLQQHLLPFLPPKHNQLLSLTPPAL